MFAPEYGIPEDPATGSSTGPLAAFMMRHGLISAIAGTRFVSEQGTKMGRRSLLHVEIHGEAGKDGIDVGGHVTLIAEATMSLKQKLRCHLVVAEIVKSGIRSDGYTIRLTHLICLQ
jgi:PhzF family phenazine biosynthesis protein